MKEYRADIGALQVIQIMLCLIGAGLSFAAAHFLVRWVRIMWIVVGISAGTAALLALIGLPLFFRRLRCYASGTQITVRAEPASSFCESSPSGLTGCSSCRRSRGRLTAFSG